MRSAQQWGGLPSVLTSSRFEEENQRLLELNQRCQFASYATMQWLDIRLQLMGAAVVSAIAVIALVQHQQGLANPGTTMGPIPLTLGAGHSRSLTQAHPHVSLPHPAPLSSPTQCHHHPHFNAEESMGRGGSGTRPRLLRSSFPCSCLPHYSIPSPFVSGLPPLIASFSGCSPVLLCPLPASLLAPVTCSPMLGSLLSTSLPHTSQCPGVPQRMAFLSPGLVGLVLSYALSLTGLLSGLVSSFTQTEGMMVSVERLEEYSCGVPQEPRRQPLQVSRPLPLGLLI